MPELPPAKTPGERIADEMLPAVRDWYEGKRDRGGNINTNVMCVGLHISVHLSHTSPLRDEDYLTTSQSQVRGAGGTTVRKILASHGEKRPFTSEAGRTSRRTVDYARQLVDLLNEHTSAHALEEAPDEVRQATANRLQSWFVGKIQQDYFNRQRISAELDPSKPTRLAVHALLEAGKNRPGTVAGAVAQHLVGAKLSLRFPNVEVSNENYTTADQQTERPGDFLLGDTAFHVTMSPSQPLFDQRCRANLAEGYRPWVLVPEDRIAAARQLAELSGLIDRTGVQSIEDFVGTNVEEMAHFDGPTIKSGLRNLLERYNERVRAVEPDVSLAIDIPTNL